MKDTTVAARYAKALFLVTEKRSETARALEDLQALRPLLEKGSRLAEFLGHPQVLIDDRRAVVRRVLEGRVLPVVAVFVDLLLRKKRLDQFATAVEEFQALVEKALGIVRAQVTSATPLVEDELRRLQGVLETTTRAHVRLTSDVDPALLGGARVRIGDRVIDRTVRTLLATIEEQLTEVNV